jgi:hypothetical protein
MYTMDYFRYFSFGCLFSNILTSVYLLKTIISKLFEIKINFVKNGYVTIILNKYDSYNKLTK